MFNKVLENQSKSRRHYEAQKLPGDRFSTLSSATFGKKKLGPRQFFWHCLIGMLVVCFLVHQFNFETLAIFPPLPVTATS
jgi:hypothetical protein